MTELLDRAIAIARDLSPDMQDDIAEVVMQLAGDARVVPLSPDERAAIEQSKQAAARAEFASDDQVRAIWAKHGL